MSRVGCSLSGQRGACSTTLTPPTLSMNGVFREAYELTRATDVNRVETVVTVRFRTLPDVRRPFEGVVESRFGIAVNGQEGHAIGTAQAYWKDGSVQVRLLPTSPWWVADRPLESTLTYSDGGVQLETVRLEVPSP